jgi:hypothetical protein
MGQKPVKLLYSKLPLFLGHQSQGLVKDGAAERNDQSSALFQLFDKRRRNMIGGSRNHDCVKRRMVRPAEIAVRIFDINISVAEFLQPGSRPIGQRLAYL